MEKDHLYAYWNYSRIVKTIPESEFGKPNVQQFLNTYTMLEMEFNNYMKELNSRDEKTVDNP